MGFQSIDAKIVFKLNKSFISKEIQFNTFYVFNLTQALRC